MEVSTSRAVIGARVDDTQALLRNIAATLPRTQVLREIPFNAIQACQRAMSAGAASGLVVVDYLMTAPGVRKLRVWDTGDGMTRQDLHERLVGLSASDRTGRNFGIGAKVSLTRVSPYGVVYTSLRDGAAYAARWQYDAASDEWGLAVLDPDAADDLSRTTVPVPLETLPEEIRAAGHGTTVLILGESPDDPTATSLRPEGSSSKRWALEVLNDRFTEFPEGITVKVVMADVERDADGKFRDERREVAGSAGNLKYYTRHAKGSSDPVTGARGKIAISGPVPATAYWWVLPEGATPPSYMRVGGKVRVVVDGEAYETHGARYMTTAGVWTHATRVEIHFVPDESIGIATDVQRTTLKVDGMPLPLLEWCEEFKRSMPAAVKNLLEGASRTRASSDFTSQLAELHTRLAAVSVARRGARRSGDGGVPTGQLVAVAGGSHSGSGARTGRVRGGRLARALLRRPGSPAQAGVGDGGRLELVPVLSFQDGVPGRRVAASVAPPPPMPSFAWVNEHSMGDDPELGSLAGRFVPGENLLVLNCQGATYRRLLGSYQKKYRSVPGSRERVEGQVREYFQLLLADAVLGSQRDFPQGWEQMVSPEALTVRASGVYHIDTRLRQVFCRMWKGVVPADELSDAEVA